MNNSLLRIVLFGFLLMLVITPFAGVAPLMLILLGLGIIGTIGSLIQAFFTADSEQKDKNA